MTTQKASELFGIDRSVISKLCKNNFIIGAHKDSSNKWVIPDETKVILDKNAIVEGHINKKVQDEYNKLVKDLKGAIKDLKI